MDEGLRRAIHDMTLQARELLITGVRELLEGTYGLDASGTLAPVERLPALRDNPEAQETRRRLEKFLEDEARAGLRGRESVEKLIKEVAFTHLNRLVAFKMLEARKLIRQTLARGPESNAFKFYLVEHPEDEERWKAGDVDTAYRHFLLWQCAQMAKEIKVLFDPDNLASRLFPRPRALKELLDTLNAPALQEAWSPNSDETIGWVYQGFNAEELEKAFREARLSKKKFEAQDIPAVTQLFTPRWIVRYLVENTLGRLWVSMHPDSALASKLGYLVPLQSPTAVPVKQVSEIRLLDPACGTMHFGLVAFDLFVEMYREEMERAGQPGWPNKPSVAKEEDIPAAIIRNNIYGIDIDLRSVQLSALTLYLKAKTFNPKAQLDESRLACADIHMFDGDRLKTFLVKSGITRPIYSRILTELQNRLKDAEQLGSLLRLDEEIRVLVEKERQRYEREGREPDLFGWSSEQFESEAGRREFWEMLEVQIGQALDAFARQQAEQGQDHSFFVGETTKGLQLLEVMANRYDVVVTNPPYMSQRKMNDVLKKLVTEAFPNGKGNLYAAFIQRCVELAADGGRVGMLTMHSFMFISSYERLRQWVCDCATIETLVHAGPGLFDVGNPGTLQTAAYVLHRETEEERKQQAVGVYFRLVKEPNGEAKRLRFEQALDRLRSGEDDPAVYRGRFMPGVEGALGCAIVKENSASRHLFPPAVETQLRALLDADGIAVLDKDHPDDLPPKVEQALILMLGEEGTAQVIAAIGGEPGQPEEILRRFLERDFFTKYHIKWYRKRPTYWLLQSPRKHYSLYLYHERITRDTLPLIRGSRYLEGKINQTLHRIKEVRDAAKTAEGRNKRKLEKDLDTLQIQLADLEAFDQAIQRVLNAQNERDETVGWEPEIDDGVILNLAPLHALTPSWKTEPKKYWEALERGEYDWSHTAMRYWPDRVLGKCRKNKSYAIAHDRLDVYEGDRT